MLQLIIEQLQNLMPGVFANYQLESNKLSERTLVGTPTRVYVVSTTDLTWNSIYSLQELHFSVITSHIDIVNCLHLVPSN